MKLFFCNETGLTNPEVHRLDCLQASVHLQTRVPVSYTASSAKEGSSQSRSEYRTPILGA